MTLESLLAEYRTRAEQTLAHWLPASHISPAHLHEAMRYAALGGGKRVRPALVYMTGQAVGVPLEHLDGPACAMELMHVYSLVHDDLPAMDDDALRRGKPTTHVAYDEATAILAGDALQSLAFRVLAHDPRMIDDPAVRLRMIDTLAMAAGSRGMAGGQAMDLAAAGREIGVAELEDMHIHKTGALIRASVRLAALSRPDIEIALLDGLERYAKCIGLAFQIRDDILDVEADTQTLGKPQGSDQAGDKPTYPTLLGMDEAKRLADALYADALDALAPLGEQAAPLRALAEYIVQRPN